MQSKTAPPRDSLTDAQVVALIEAENVEMDFGCELLDSSDTFVEDISADVLGFGGVEHGNYRTIHGTCQLRVSKELVWGSQRVKPYMTLSDGSVSARVNLGVFLLDTPERAAGETPATFEVEGYDKLAVLDTPYGSTYRVASGAGYLATVDALIQAAGETKIRIDQTSASTTLPADKVYPLDEKNTTLHICNDLLAAVGYRALWVDQDGYYRSEPYEAPSGRAAEWTYDTASSTTTVAEERVAEADYFGAPNRWVFVRDDPAQDAPTAGAGIYTVTNQSDGPTSIDSRGRTITRIVRLDAADQTSLQTQGDRIVERDKKVAHYLNMTVGPNPLHLHFDVVQVVDNELGINHKYVLHEWSLPFDGGDMQLRMRRV